MRPNPHFPTFVGPSPTLPLVLAAAVGLLAAPDARPVAAQESPQERDRVLAVAEAALQAVSEEDFVAFTDLMIDEAFVMSAGERYGVAAYSARGRAEERAQTFDRDIVERGFDPEVRISGPVAMVWLPYDLYIDGEWSHCGVDTFTMVRTADGWRIAAMAWTVEQPPACRPHPDGPPV